MVNGKTKNSITMRILAAFAIISISIPAILQNQANAEVDAAKLSEMLSKLGGDTASSGTTVKNTDSSSAASNTGAATADTPESNEDNTEKNNTDAQTQEKMDTSEAPAINTGNVQKTPEETQAKQKNEVKNQNNQASLDSLNSEEPEKTNLEKTDNTSSGQTNLDAAGPEKTEDDSQKSEFEIVKIENSDGRATFTFKLTNDIPEVRKFEFKYTDEKGTIGKSLSFEKEKIMNSSGEYVWYIPNLGFSKYSISIDGVNAEGEKISGLMTKSTETDLSLGSAGKCVIPDITGLRVVSGKESSTLYWDEVVGAVTYNVYMKNSDGNYNFLEETKINSYVVPISDGKVSYNEFSVKAKCADGTESLRFVPSTKVRTGPAENLIFGLISLIIGYVIVRKRKFVL